MQEKSNLIIISAAGNKRDAIRVETTKTFGEITVLHDDAFIRSVNFTGYYNVYSDVTVYYISSIKCLLDSGEDEREIATGIINNFIDEIINSDPNADIHTVNFDFENKNIIENHNLPNGKCSIKNLVNDIIDKKMASKLLSGLKVSRKAVPYHYTEKPVSEFAFEIPPINIGASFNVN